jgi:hypothetical protein
MCETIRSCSKTKIDVTLDNESQEVIITIDLKNYKMKSIINLKQLENNIENIGSNWVTQQLTEKISSILGYKVEITKK